MHRFCLYTEASPNENGPSPLRFGEGLGEGLEGATVIGWL